MLAIQLLLSAPFALAPMQEGAVELPSETFAEHDAPIVQLVADSKDKRLLTVTSAGEIRAWKVQGREPLWTTTHMGAGNQIELSGIDFGDETVVYSVLAPAVTELDAETGNQMKSIGGPNVMARSTGVAGDPKDRWAWIACDDGSVVRINPKDVQGWSRRNLKNGGCTTIARDRRGDLLAVGGKDKTIRFVNAKSASVDKKKVFEGHEQPVTTLAFDGKGSRLISGDEEGVLRVWKVSSGKCQETLEVHAAPITRIACEAKGKYMATGDKDGVIKLWDLKKMKELATLTADGAVSGLAFIDKGKTLVWTGGNEHMTLVDLSEL